MKSTGDDRVEDESASLRWYHVPDPSGVVLLDTNVLQGWKGTDFHRIANAYRIAVPECLLMELCTRQQGSNAVNLLQKLKGLRCVLVSGLNLHCRWELEHVKPVGLLLNDDLNPTDPEKAAQTVIQRLCDGGYDSDMDELKEVDEDSALSWESFHSPVVEALHNHPSVIAARKVGRVAFLDAWMKRLDNLRHVLKDSFREFARGFYPSGRVPQDTILEELMDFRNMIFRTLCLVGLNSHLNVIAKPDRFTHQRLNQRVDMIYVALTSPGMILATREDEMHALLRVVSPKASAVKNPEELCAK